MKYIITEDQYKFLKYGFRQRAEYMDDFKQEVQDILEENMESILNEINKNGTINVLDLMVGDDIKLGYGDRAYDFTVYALVEPNETHRYFMSYPLVSYIRNMVREKFGFKTSVSIGFVEND